MKKVLFIILGLDFSGAENVLLQYLHNNNEIDPCFVFVFEGNASREFSHSFEEGKIYELKIPYKKNELRFFPRATQYRFKKAVLPVIKQIKPDVLYFNNTHEVILSRSVIKALRITSVGHVHDMKDSIGTYPKRHEAKQAFYEMTEVLTVSEACKKSWDTDKMKVVYNGVADEFFRKTKPIELKKPLTIGYVGMISKRKGFDLLAHAIDALGDFVCWKIAYNLIEGEYQEVLNNVRNKNNVCMFYRIPRSQMKEFYDTIDILVIPSRQDPLPTVAIEAMARKTLVLGADTGGIPELVGSGKYLFQREDSYAFEKKIIEYCSIDETELKNCIDEQYEYAFKLFRDINKKQIINSMITK